MKRKREIRKKEKERNLRTELNRSKMNLKHDKERLEKQLEKFLDIAKKANEIGDITGEEAAKNAWKMTKRKILNISEYLVKLDTVEGYREVGDITASFYETIGEITRHSNMTKKYLDEHFSINDYFKEHSDYDKKSKKLDKTFGDINQAYEKNVSSNFLEENELDKQYNAALKTASNEKASSQTKALSEEDETHLIDRINELKSD